MEVFVACVANMSVLIVIMLVVAVRSGELKIQWRRKFAHLNRKPQDSIDALFEEPIKNYVLELHKECIRARIRLNDLPVHAAAEASREIDRYWSTSISDLMRVNQAATERALERHGLTREHPCQVKIVSETPA